MLFLSSSTICCDFPIVVHLTNVAIQKTHENYDEKGCKWSLRQLRLYFTSKHGREETDKCFSHIQEIVVRSLLAVQKTIIQDKHCFELYGYDILIDENLRPWLLEGVLLHYLSTQVFFDSSERKSQFNCRYKGRLHFKTRYA